MPGRISEGIAIFTRPGPVLKRGSFVEKAACFRGLAEEGIALCCLYGIAKPLRVLPDGTAVGRFAGSADYMLLRSHRPAGGPARRWREATTTEVMVSDTMLDPRAIRYAPISVDLLIATLVPGVVSRFYSDDTGATLWILDAAGPGGSWASVDYEPGRRSYRVEQTGERRLWDEVEAAYFRWLSLGRPDITRFGMTITDDIQRVWLDCPDINL